MLSLQTSISEIGNILPTKGNASNLAKAIVEDVQNNFIDPFEIVTKCEAIKLVCDEVRAGVEPLITAELPKYGKDGNKVLDATFTVAEVGVKYDYSTDKRWAELNAQEQAIAEQRKDREKFLKGISKAFVETDIETGESYEVHPPNKTSKTSFKVSLAK